MLTLLLLLGTWGSMAIVCLVSMELLLTWGFLCCWLRAGLSCISIVPSILQSQDSSMQHCKALPGKAVGKPLGPVVAPLRTGARQNHLQGLLQQVLGPKHRDSRK